MKQARLIYKTSGTGAEFEGKDFVVRAYKDSNMGVDLKTDVIYFEGGERQVKVFADVSGKKLAEKAADFVNGRILKRHVVLCINELNQASPTNFVGFQTAFASEIDAITEEKRAAQEKELKARERTDKLMKPYRDKQIAEAKKKIFGE